MQNTIQTFGFFQHKLANKINLHKSKFLDIKAYVNNIFQVLTGPIKCLAKS